jgi:glycosyltransferase involved in cell wall biosynthesis
MKFSFVVIAYNEEENIVKCIESIQALKKLPAEHEIIVVNDGSGDNTGQLVSTQVKKYNNIKLLDQENKGRGAARAAGLLMATGKLIATVDGDIILPSIWLTKCKAKLNRYDAVSATPIPDGDVAYIYRRFRLYPKIVSSSTTINGSNGLYKREIFSKIQFDSNLREGEDTDFNYKLAASGYRLLRLRDLTVLHNENKSFRVSLKWLYEYGYSATRHLKKFKQIRVPDLAFFSFLIVGVLSVSACFIYRTAWFILAPLLYSALTSLIHLRSKFVFKLKVSYATRFILGWFANVILINCYYTGRIIGILQWQNIDTPDAKSRAEESSL